jgi:putative GTP pyrophosphokinase
MTNAGNTRKSDPVDEVLASFIQKRDLLKELCIKTRNLIEDCLEDRQLKYQSVQARVKKNEKLREKYIVKNYTQLDDITDQAALRIITYYQDEIDQVAEMIRNEFKLIPECCIDKRQIDPDRFGYHAFNFVCTHADKRTLDVQFKKFAEVRFEIQVTSILSHAWSEIEHEWYDLKDAYPDEIKRRFSRQAALLEAAESEFLNLRAIKMDFNNSVALRFEAGVLDLLVNPVSLKTFIMGEPIVTQMDSEIASILKVPFPSNPPSDSRLNLWSVEVRMARLETLQSLRDALTRCYPEVLEYVDICREIWKTLPTAQIPIGVCIYHLSMMMIAMQGQDKLEESMTRVKSRLSKKKIEGQYKVASHVMNKKAFSA